jgi:putative acyl-CoA dehydrogenase
VLADLALEYEGAVALAMRTARAFDAEDDAGKAFARLAVALGKYWLTKRTPGFVYECMECLGGGGYIEESPMPRLFRESPLNAIWEGSGNVIALDILRTLAKEPAAMDAYVEEIAAARGASAVLDQAAEALIARAATTSEDEARGAAERMALVLQAALLARHGPPEIADAFIAGRIGSDRGATYGALTSGADVAAILARQTAS